MDASLVPLLRLVPSRTRRAAVLQMHGVDRWFQCRGTSLGLVERIIQVKGEYQHGIWCSAGPRTPRTPGGCSCHSCDLFLNRLNILRHDGDQAKRTIRIAACPGCHNRTEFPFTSEYVPKEVFCIKCSLWAPVEEISWDGLDFAKLLPVFERP